MKKKKILNILAIILGIMSCFSFAEVYANETTSVFTNTILSRSTSAYNSATFSTSTDKILGISSVRESKNEYTWNPNTAGEAKTVWKIATYASESSTQRDYTDLYYCLNAAVGFGITNGNMAEGKTDIYSDIFDMKDTSKKETISTLASGNLGANYNKILWILDNSYIPTKDTKYKTSTEYKNLMKNANITIENNETDLTEEQIEVVQQMAIWYFTNSSNTTYNNSNLPSIYLNGKQLTGNYYATDAYGTQIDGKVIQNKMNTLYKYFIQNASNTYKSAIPTLELSNTNVEVIEEGNSYIVGPFSLTGTNTNQIKEILPNCNKSYTLLSSNSSEDVVSGNDFTKVIGSNFYLKISKSDITENTKIEISLKYKYDVRSLTFITDVNEASSTQPVVLVKTSEFDPTITKDANIELKEVSVEKIWSDNNNQDGIRQENVKVQLYRNDKAYGDKITLNKDNNWTYTWTKLLANKDYKYSVKELNTENKPVKDNEKLNNKYTVTYLEEGNKTIITNTHVPETIDITGTKTWEDNNNQDGVRPNSITVNLLADGKEIKDITVTAEEDWKYSFTNLAKYSEGKEIIYTITEDSVEKYTTTIKGFNITNKYIPETIEKTVLKVWDDNNNQDGLRPSSVEVTLYKTINQEKQEVEKVELNVENNWTYTWNKLDKYENGKEIVYTVAETVPEGYTPTYSEDTFTITNKYTPDKTAKTVIKEWSDKDNQDGIRPESVKVQLFANNKVCGEVIELNKENGFTYTWIGLPLKENGKQIVYSVQEIEIPTGYAVEYSSEDYSKTNEITIINKYVPEVISKTVIKKWEDNNNQDKIRPESVEVQLYKEIDNTKTSMGEKYKVVLNKDNNWTYTWENLEAKKDGKQIVYSVQEETVPEGYTVEYSSEDYSKTNEITVTNRYIPETINKTVIKKWEDNNNQDKIRPESVEVQLYKKVDNTKTSMGEKYKVVLNEENNWTYTWLDLDIKEDGKPIIYSVEEIQVPTGYTVEYSSSDYSTANEITITNTHIPKEFDLSLRKFITKINDTEYSREPIVDTSTIATTGTATYKHTKQPIAVQKGDVVTYTIRVYNEGEVDGYVEMITDHLPDNLIPITIGTEGIDEEKYAKEIEFNLNWGWINSEDGKSVTTMKTAKANSETYSLLEGYEEITDTKLDAYVEGSDKLDYIDVQIKCLVSDKAISGEYITNIAEISKMCDIDGVEVNTDRDSTKANANISNLTNYKNEQAITSTTESYIEGQEDDDDFEKLVVKEFDLSLRKFITKVNQISYSRAPKVDTSKLGTTVEGKVITTAKYNHTKEPVIVETNDIVTYTIRIYNEGTIAGFANEITDNIPEGLEFMPNSDINVSYRWKMLDKDGNTTEDIKEAVIITTNYLSNIDKNNIINAVSEVEGVKALSYKDVQVQFKVIAKAEKLQDNLIINEAQISADSDNDIDSVPNRDEKYDYVSEKNEDDIDYEPLKLQYFDLALRKFITKVNSVDYNNRYPEIIYNENGSITYNHTKDPVLVTTEDIVTYTIRIYNEGEKAGYATEITDNLPDGLEFIPDNETNKEYNWKMIDSDGNITEDLNKAVKFTTDYLKNELINPLVEENGSKVLSYNDVKIAFKVIEPNTSDRILVNIAQISADSDDDIDSVPNNSIETEDDIDKEYVKVQYFDLSIKKWVTASKVTYKGKTTTTKTGFTEDSEGIAKVDLVADKMTKTTVKFVYSIKVTNEGELPGYAYEVKDYIPKGLKFVAEDNKDWKELEDGTVVTDKLKDTLLNPGESATVEIVLTWKNSTTNTGLKTNYAEISSDSAEDIDSTPDNYNKKEDDIDDAQVLLSIKTAGATTYIGLILTTIVILAGGILLIKKYVID